MVGFELCLKFEAERRLKINSTIESQIKLLKLFTEIMDIAEARRETILSKEVLTYLIDSKQIDSLLDNKKNSKTPFLVSPVGRASQLTAISSIYNLAKKHKILREPSIQALKNLKGFQDEKIQELAENYLTKLD